MIRVKDRVTTIVFDFDGVIKDSVEVKSSAFHILFSIFGEDIAARVKEHHELNGGVSRFDKLPIYLEWAGQPSSKSQVKEYEKKFSRIVTREVVISEWVPGVLEFMNCQINRKLFLLTATPQNEIKKILLELGIYNIFMKVIGSPIKKNVGLKSILRQYSIKPINTLMIGDSIEDYEAANESNVDFILRKTNFNQKLQEKLNCTMIDNFL